MKRLFFVISSIVTTMGAIACDSEYTEQAHHTGRIFLIVAVSIALLSWVIGLWNRLGAKARCLLRSFGLMVAFNFAVLGITGLCERATDYDDSLISQFLFLLILLLPIIDIIWAILTFRFWRKKIHQGIHNIFL